MANWYLTNLQKVTEGKKTFFFNKLCWCTIWVYIDKKINLNLHPISYAKINSELHTSKDTIQNYKCLGENLHNLGLYKKLEFSDMTPKTWDIKKIFFFNKLNHPNLNFCSAQGTIRRMKKANYWLRCL